MSTHSSLDSTLSDLGVNADYLFYAAQVAGPELEEFLGQPLDSIIESLAGTVNLIGNELVERFEKTEYPLGAMTMGIEPISIVPGMKQICDAAKINLISQMPPIRDQGGRGTCVAHAILSAYEHFLIKNGVAQPDKSEQFVYWNCKQNDGVPNSSGTWLRVATPLLNRDGACEEQTWPYNPTPIPGNEGQNPPPPRAIIEALSARSAASRSLAPTSVQDIKAELCRGNAVAFSIPVFNSWYRNNYVKLTGEIGMPIPREVRVGGHAMCFVGYEDLPNEPVLGGGRFYIRNSWGTSSWGSTSRLGAGYGTIPYAYIARFGMEAFCVE